MFYDPSVLNDENNNTAKHQDCAIVRQTCGREMSTSRINVGGFCKMGSFDALLVHNPDFDVWLVYIVQCVPLTLKYNEYIWRLTSTSCRWQAIFILNIVSTPRDNTSPHWPGGLHVYSPACASWTRASLSMDTDTLELCWGCCCQLLKYFFVTC